MWKRVADILERITELRESEWLELGVKCFQQVGLRDEVILTITLLAHTEYTGASGRSRPEFIRPPKPGKRCPYTGMARTSLNALYVPSKVNNFDPPVRAVCLRNPGTTRGIWLINYDSLMDYLDRLMEGGLGQPYFAEKSLDSVTSDRP